MCDLRKHTKFKLYEAIALVNLFTLLQVNQIVFFTSGVQLVSKKNNDRRWKLTFWVLKQIIKHRKKWSKTAVIEEMWLVYIVGKVTISGQRAFGRIFWMKILEGAFVRSELSERAFSISFFGEWAFRSF